MSGQGSVDTNAGAATSIANGKGAAPTVVPATGVPATGGAALPTVPITPAVANMNNIAPSPTQYASPSVPTYVPPSASTMPQIVQQPLPSSGMTDGLLSQLLQAAQPANVPQTVTAPPPTSGGSQ